MTLEDKLARDPELPDYLDAIIKKFRKEENDVRSQWIGSAHTHYRNGILEGIRLAEIIVRQELRREQWES